MNRATMIGGLLLALSGAGTACAQSLPDALRPIGNLPAPLDFFIPHYQDLNQPYNWTGFQIKPIITYQTVSLRGSGSAFLKDPSGVSLGIDGAYNFQYGNVVFGPAADIAYSFMDGKGHDDWRNILKSEMDVVGSIRGRLGYAFDRTLVYATGGYAFANLEVKDRVLNISDSTLLSGWTAGGGLEYLWSDSATLRLEYRYSRLGDKSFSSLPDDRKVGAAIHTITTGFSTKF